MKRVILLLVAVAVVAGFCVAFPPFHVRSTKQVLAERAAAAFNPANFVTTIWEQLQKNTEKATDARELLVAIAADPQKARAQFGRIVGLNDAYFYYIRGSGRVVSVDADTVGLAVNTEGNNADVTVPLGLVFGNAIRDGSGLVDSSKFPNAQQVNEISAGLNALVETKVLPELQRIAVVGKRVQFAGFVEVGDESLDLKPLKLVPVSVKLD